MGWVSGERAPLPLRLDGRGERGAFPHRRHARNAHMHTHSYTVGVIGTSIYIFLIIKDNGTANSARDD